MQMVVLVSD